MPQLTTGEPVPEDGSHRQLRPDGQQKGYVVMTEEERAKGFVKPVRHTYVHSGMEVCGEHLRPYVSEHYGEGAMVICGGPRGHGATHGAEESHNQYVATAKELARIAATGRFKGCGGETKMGRSLAETYAADPTYYSGTFCVHCGAHFPLNEFLWSDGEPMDTRLQAAYADKMKAVEKQRRDQRIVELTAELTRLKAEQ